MPPDDDLRARLIAAREKAKALRELTESLNERLKTVEATLVSMNLGVTAVVPLPREGASLWFRRYGDVWQLVVETAEWTPLINANRELRMAAAGCLSQLLDELLANVDDTASRVGSAITSLDELAERLARTGDRG